MTAHNERSAVGVQAHRRPSRNEWIGAGVCGKSRHRVIVCLWRAEMTQPTANRPGGSGKRSPPPGSLHRNYLGRSCWQRRRGRGHKKTAAILPVNCADVRSARYSLLDDAAVRRRDATFHFTGLCLCFAWQQLTDVPHSVICPFGLFEPSRRCGSRGKWAADCSPLDA